MAVEILDNQEHRERYRGKKNGQEQADRAEGS
jgi:hypothetical protein